MRIVCPGCAATYDVPEVRIPPGRLVRCARCETDWAPVQAPAAADEPEPEEPEPEPEPDVVDDAAAEADEAAPEWEPPPSASPTDRYAVSSGTKHVRALRAAWALTAVILLAAAGLAYSARESVMQSWPPSIRAYAALGLSRSP